VNVLADGQRSIAGRRRQHRLPLAGQRLGPATEECGCADHPNDHGDRKRGGHQRPIRAPGTQLIDSRVLESSCRCVARLTTFLSRSLFAQIGIDMPYEILRIASPSHGHLLRLKQTATKATVQLMPGPSPHNTHTHTPTHARTHTHRLRCREATTYPRSLYSQMHRSRESSSFCWWPSRRPTSPACGSR
jgi:hypothetical protein